MKSKPLCVTLDEEVVEAVRCFGGRSFSWSVNHLLAKALDLNLGVGGGEGEPKDIKNEGLGLGAAIKNCPEEVVKNVEGVVEGRAVPSVLLSLPTVGEMRGGVRGVVRAVDPPSVRGVEVPVRPQDRGLRVGDVVKKGSKALDADFFEDGGDYVPDATEGLDPWECPSGVAGMSEEAFAALVFARDGDCRVVLPQGRHGGDLLVFFVEGDGRNSQNVVTACEACAKALEKMRSLGNLKRLWGRLEDWEGEPR